VGLRVLTQATAAGLRIQAAHLINPRSTKRRTNRCSLPDNLQPSHRQLAGRYEKSSAIVPLALRSLEHLIRPLLRLIAFYTPAKSAYPLAAVAWHRPQPLSAHHSAMEAPAASGNSDNIQVYARVRPVDGGAARKPLLQVDATAGAVALAGQTFTFDHAAGPEVTQVSSSVARARRSREADASARGGVSLRLPHGQSAAWTYVPLRRRRSSKPSPSPSRTPACKGKRPGSDAGPCRVRSRPQPPVQALALRLPRPRPAGSTAASSRTARPAGS
jgi:hypothetical protein